MSHRREENIFLKQILTFVTAIGLSSSRLVDYKISNASRDQNYIFANNNNYEAGYTMNTPGCSIPAMKVRDPSIEKLILYPWGIKPCSNPNIQRPLLRSNQTHIWTVVENFINNNVLNTSSFKCCYRSFHRLPTSEIVYLDCIMFEDIIEAANEFVKVECYYKDKVIHKQFFVFVPKKAFTTHRELPFEDSRNKSRYNVIILGLSSVSRLNFRRTMPHTFNLLMKLGAVELLGYHAVGDNTLDNIMPILAGMRTHELNITYWPLTPTHPGFDSIPFLWERYKDVGYYTALLEDTAHLGIFNSKIHGFSGIPTDYYIYPFIQASEQIEPPTLPERKVFFKGAKNFLKLWKTLKLGLPPNISTCMGDKYYFQVVLEYIERLTAVLKTSRLFGLFWESSLQQNINAPIVLDHEYKALIHKLNSTGYLDETILIVVSDEGSSREEVQKTKQGRLEHRLPLAAILMPPTFREKYTVAYESLKLNSHRLTTPFDLHRTLIDLIFLDALENDEVLHRNKNKFLHARGMSLFVPIHSNRTCESAGIEAKSCTCLKMTEVNISTQLVQEASNFVVTRLNVILRLYPKCAQLEMDSKVEFKEIWPSYGDRAEWRDFRFVFKLKPGAVKYEALLRYDDHGWSLLTHVRRLSEYAGQGWCVREDIITRLYCYCL